MPLYPLFLAAALSLLGSWHTAAAQSDRVPGPAPAPEGKVLRGGFYSSDVPTDADRAALAAMGGVEGLRSINRILMQSLLTDPRIRDEWTKLAPARLDQIEMRLTEQFCEVLGGDCVYSGPKMKNIHRGLAFTRVQFNAIVENLQDAMDERRVPFAAQNRLLAKLAPMHRDIVEK